MSTFARDLRIGLGYLISVATQNWWYLAATLEGERQRVQADKQRRRAIEAYNASLVDRLEMVEYNPRQARTLAYGRVRAVEGVRRDWETGTYSENLTLAVSFAGHEIDAFESWYLNDLAVTLDGSGWANEAPYRTTKQIGTSEGGTLDGSGAATITLSHTPTAGTVAAVWSDGTGESREEGSCSVSVSGATVTITGGRAGKAVNVSYSYGDDTKRVRIRPYLGTASQNIGGDLAAEYPGKITSSDKAAGVAMAIVDLVYDTDVFPQGRPTVTAVFRGKKVYDPRKDSTVSGGSGSHRLATPSTWEWSENPALIAYDYARDAHGWAVPAAEINTADVMAAANACDVSTTFTLTGGSTGSVTLPRYRCGIVIPTDADPLQAMDDIMASMNGRYAWSGGVLRMRAGVLNTTAFSMDDSWLVEKVNARGQADGEPIITAAQAYTRAQRVNRISGTCVDPDQRYQMLPFPAVEDATLISAKGEREAEIALPAVNHIAHAQHLASMAIRQAQAGQRIELRCGLKALDAELLDVFSLTYQSARHGISAKLYEVVGWRWAPDDAIRIQAAEISAALFTVDATLEGRDPAPDSGLREPWDVEQITGVSVTSGTTATLDGSVLTRTTVSWTAAIGQSVRQGGEIEVQYTPAADTVPAGDAWASWTEPGTATQAVIPGLLAGRFYKFRVRAVQKLPLVRGAWSSPAVTHQVATRPQVDTGGIAADAVTQVFTSTAAYKSQSTILSETGITISAGGLYGAAEFTLDDTYQCLVTVNYRLANTFGSAAQGYSFVAINKDADSTDYGGRVWTRTVVAGMEIDEAYSIVADFSLGPGQHVVGIRYTGKSTSHTPSYSNVEPQDVYLKVEVIKR